MRFARLKHDNQVQVRELDRGYNGNYPYPETRPLFSTPAGRRKDDIPYTSRMLEHLVSLQHTKTLALRLTQIGQGHFNRAGNTIFVENFKGQIPIFNLDELPKKPLADPISSGGNLVNVLEDVGHAVKVETIYYRDPLSKIAGMSWHRAPWLFTKHTSVNPSNGAIGLVFGDDAYFPNYSKLRGGLYVSDEWIEYFPSLPRRVTVKVASRLVRSTPDELKSNVVGEVSRGQEVTIHEYAPRGSNVWGRIDEEQWIELLYTRPGIVTEGAFLYTTNWRMDTQPPYVIRGEAPNIGKEISMSTPEEPPTERTNTGAGVLQGKGFYLWQISRVEKGNPDAIANLAKQAGLSHVLIKVADGRYDYNVKDSVDAVPPLVTALRARGIQAWGWHYIYGHYPTIEAERSIRRVKQLNLDGFVVNAEKEFKVKGMDTAAREYMSKLRSGLPNTPIGFSSYRYPSYHRPLPFETFLEYSDINMPQVYWVQSTNPGAQLLKSLREYQNLNTWRIYFPTGAAYKEHGWTATPEQVSEFLHAVREYNLPGCNFWEWYYACMYEKKLWNPVAEFPWSVGEDYVPEMSYRYVDALNSGDPVKVAALYKKQSVHVTSQRTLQGRDSILGWYNELLKMKLPSARFQVTGASVKDNMRTVTWTADSTQGRVLDGKDSLGVKDDKIVYHYSYFTVHQN